uniref:Uncharacterized LOC107075466 n=1 Tax=Lepisosteus oculatus TaxID=7918 RepID=W5NMD3_LEPOC|nr:PREDICTED: uncharacterized protein LOC107075466 [Lepisosteus oculatus]XP_015192167.1 PREDICTED: uncharacterized protein LOC107075466 [Lepisosteus oculatus]
MEFLLQNRKCVDVGTDVLDILARKAAELHPALKLLTFISRQILDCPESTEAQYFIGQLSKLNEKIGSIQTDFKDLQSEIEKSFMNQQYYNDEITILHHYDLFLKLMKTYTADKKDESDKIHFFDQVDGTDVTIMELYEGVMGSNNQRPILDIIRDNKKRSLQSVEQFCIHLKKLFVMELVVLCTHSKLKGNGKEEKLMEEWGEKLKDVNRKIKEVIDDCTDNFAVQARSDMEGLLQGGGADKDDEELPKQLLSFLEKKYNWVSWSVRIFNPSESRIWKLLAGNKYTSISGCNHFSVELQNIQLVVSYCQHPKPIPKDDIEKLVETMGWRRNTAGVVKTLHRRFPRYLAHVVSTVKNVKEANNFKDDHYYFKKHNVAYICIHSE